MLPSEDDMQSLLDFLSEEPPYAAIGRNVFDEASLIPNANPRAVRQ
jgi:hypothetical protein